MSDETAINQETTENTLISQNSDINTVSDPSKMPPEPLESPKNADIPVSLNNDNPPNTPILTERLEETNPAENGSVDAENPKVEPISESVQTSETQNGSNPRK